MFVEEEIDHSQLNFQPRAQVYFVSEMKSCYRFQGSAVSHLQTFSIVL